MGLNVAVLMGGTSLERDFSLRSGKQVSQALEEAGHKVVPLDTTPDLVQTLRREKFDVAYIALHGKHGDDGTVQSLLEFLEIPYVGSPASVCRSTWNKSVLPHMVMSHRDYADNEAGASNWPASITLSADAFKEMGAAHALDLVPERLPGGFPVIVKPTSQGSALGMNKVDAADDLGRAILDALSFDDEVLIEEYVEGVEISVAVLGEGWDAHALPAVEIVPKKGLFDTEARQEETAVDYYAPVRLESLSHDESNAEAIRSEIERAALEVHRAFGCRDLSRVDLIWDGARANVLECDVSPGMTELSLFPMAIDASGLSLSSVLSELVEAAAAR